MYFHMDKQLSSPKIRTSQTLPSARSIPSIARARLRPPRRARRAHSLSDACRLPRAFASPRSSRPRLSLSPLSRAFSGRFPETPRSAEEARRTRGRRADERPSRPIASTRTRARERGKISKYRARVASPVASIARSRRRLCRRGSIARRARRPTVPRFFGMPIIRSRARADARGGVTRACRRE